MLYLCYVVKEDKGELMDGLPFWFSKRMCQRHLSMYNEEYITASFNELKYNTLTFERKSTVKPVVCI